MATGAAFHIGGKEELAESPLNYRCNSAFILHDMAIYIVDCHTTQNQVSFYWKDNNDEIFDSRRGPDLCSADLEHYISTLLKDKELEEYFEASFFFKFVLFKNNNILYCSMQHCLTLY